MIGNASSCLEWKLLRMRVHLDADAPCARWPSSSQEIAEQLIVPHETSEVIFVARVHDPDDSLGRSRNSGQDLALRSAAAAPLNA